MQLNEVQTSIHTQIISSMICVLHITTYIYKYRGIWLVFTSFCSFRLCYTLLPKQVSVDPIHVLVFPSFMLDAFYKHSLSRQLHGRNEAHKVYRHYIQYIGRFQNHMKKMRGLARRWKKIFCMFIAFCKFSEAKQYISFDDSCFFEWFWLWELELRANT